MGTKALLPLVFLAAVALPAEAQVERSPRAGRGLFGGSHDPNSSKTFDASATLFTAYDDDLSRELGGLNAQQTVNGQFSGLTAGLQFDRTGRYVDFGFSAGTNYRYYATSSSFLGVADQAGARFAVKGKKQSLRLGAAAAYQPFFMFTPFAMAVPTEGVDLQAPPVDSAVIRKTAIGYSASIGVDRSLGRRSNISANYDVGRFDFSDDTMQQTSRSAGARFSHNLTKNAAVRIGYSLMQSEYHDGLTNPSSDIHNIDAGIDYNRALGLTHKVTAGFSTGSAILDQNGSRSIRMTGEAWINREIGRTWSARANYRRGFGVIPGFAQPQFADSVVASVGGLLSQKVDARAAIGFSNGELGMTKANQFDSYNITGRLRFAITEMLAIYGEYVAYRYEFDDATGLPTGLMSRVWRQGVRGGLTLWVPLVR